MNDLIKDCAPERLSKVLCVGAAVLDTLFRVDSLPTGQGKILPYEMLHVAEGMAASAAYAIAQLGGRPSLWCAVGDDDAGSRILRDLDADGVDIDGASIVNGARSAAATILVDNAGERLIIPFYDQQLRDCIKPFSDADIAEFDAVLVDVRWPPMAARVLAAARRVGIPAVLDADVAQPGIVDELAPLASHIIFSEPAGVMAAGVEDAEQATLFLGQKYPDALVSVTVGVRGSYWVDRGKGAVRHIRTLQVSAVDTLAAGDIFHGAFALFVAQKMLPEEALRLASVAAAIKCQTFGGRLGAPTLDHVFAAMYAQADISLRQTVSASKHRDGGFEEPNDDTR
jgi:sulfofructose kinase